MRFLFLADMQIGAYASFSGLIEADVQRLASEGMKVRRVAKTTSLAWDLARLNAAIDVANSMQPDLIIVGGDMVNNAESAEQRQAFFSAIGRLDTSIPIHWAPGNHDVADDWGAPTPKSLARYREHFGPDYFTFDHGASAFIIWNTAIAWDPQHVPGEWEAQVEFLRHALDDASARGLQPILIGHHPLFVKSADEPDTFWNIPRQRRDLVRTLARRYGVRIAFAGHLHRGAHAWDGDLEMVTSGPVGYPLGDDPSGYRLVEVTPDGVTHEYRALGSLGDADA